MADNNSDYKKKRIELKKLFSNPLLTNTNKALSDNLFDRFLSKEELKRVYGIIGEKTELSKEYHLDESTPQRAAFQLQPLVHKKIATVDHTMSYKDIVQRLKSNGVDEDRTDEWGRTEQFNFVPPIDLDKFSNYTNYYWYNPNDPNSIPQYITIKNKCAVAQSALAAKIAELGGVLQHTIIALNGTIKYIDIPGNFNDVFVANRVFQIESSTNNDNSYTVISSQTIGANTRVFVQESINDSIVDGYITFSSEVDQFFAERDCFCYGSVGLSDYAYDTFDFDSLSTCVVQDDQWHKENFWVHLLDVPPNGFSTAQRAEMPIIEFLSSIELNSWSFTKYNWKYRQAPAYSWVDSNVEPSIEEMNTFYLISSINAGLQTITLDSSLGNLTTLFTPGFEFSVENTAANRYVTGLFEVASSSFVGINTVITTTLPFNGIGQPVANVGFNIVPLVETSNGDTWLGFFEHWALVGEDETIPSENVTENTTIISDEFLTPDFTITDFDSAFQTIEINGNHSSLFVPSYVFEIINSTNNNGQFTTVSSAFAAGKTTITVIEPINDIVIDGEILSDSSFYLTVGNDLIALYGTDSIRVYVNNVRTYTTYVEIPNIQPNATYVDGITFDQGFPKLTKVVIEVNAAALADVGRESVSVRTDLNDLTFTSPEVVSLIQYRKTEQIKKYGVNTYPLFNIFNVDGTFNGVSEIWKFQESPEAPIDVKTGFRILTTENGKVYHLEQLLIDDETKKMFVYKDFSTISISNPDGFQTIWRIGYDGTEEYVPKYVDSDRVEIPTSNPDGDWEIPHQLFFNPNHENRKYLTSSELLQHFKSIVDSQVTPSLYQNNIDYPWRVLTTPNYGLGGYIREHNNSYDTTISTVLINNSPINVIEFAQDRYEKNVSYINNNYTTNLTKYLTTNDYNYITDFTTTVSDLIINTFELNDINNKIFGDSNTYNEVSNLGIKGWIATLPFIRMAFKYKPEFLYDDLLKIKEISCHDNHLYDYSIDPTFISDTITDILSTPHPINGTWGTSQAASPPSLYSIYSGFGGSVGKYWNDTSTNNLYRFRVISVGLTQPFNPPSNALWFDVSTNLLKAFNGSFWSNVSGIPDDISQAWELMDLETIFASIVLDVEDRLYSVAPQLTSLAYDISILESDPNFDLYLEEAFLNLMTLRGNSNPYSVDGYFNSSNAFTWNYKDVNVTNVNYPTTISNTNEPWGSTWWDIYYKIFGTYYPHLEPWKLQGYIDKPTWWNSYYLWNVDDSRRWQPLMWTNIGGGIIPVGELLPDNTTIGTGLGGQIIQYSHFCVDISNDELLPPYVSSSPQTLLNNIVDIPATIDDEYSFGENGPEEWEWRKSTQYQYDRLKVAYRLQPIKFLHNTFGEKFYNIGGLNIDQRSENVYSHKDAIFHGDMIDDTTTFVVDGLNQWYINYNRTIDLDNTVSDFRQLWTEWNTNLAYQFDSFISLDSFKTLAKYFDLSDNDYEILVKTSKGVSDYWLDALQITNTKYTPKRMSGDHGDDWEFTITIPSTISREIEYYDVNTSVINTQFIALGGATTSQIWDHYELDKNVIKTSLVPFTITGIQNVINFVDGYSSLLRDTGFIFNNTDAIEQDPNTGRTITWDYEIERFIDENYKARNAQKRNNEVEINPFRNNVWFRNTTGVISNVVTGPYTSIRRENTIYDQYGRIIKNENLQVYRQDSLGHISLLSPIENDVFPSGSYYDYLHIGGIHLFLDAYEHVILFNNYTADNSLIYDQFLGLSVPRLFVEFDGQVEKTQRPNVGGMFLNDGDLLRNIEASIDDISLYYDTNVVNENSKFISDARSLLGYNTKDIEFLDHLFVSDKSKFLFWRGMIQNKGSINSVKAFLNSKHFIDAQVDEFWAYKASEFGDNDRRVYPELKLNTNDVVNDKLLLEFTESTPTQDFIQVSYTDQERWFEWTEQLEKLISNKFFFDAEVTSKISSPIPVSGEIFKTDIICDDIRVPFYQGLSKYTNPSFTGTLLTTSFNYIVGGNNIEVFVDGEKTKEFSETSSTQITFNTPLLNSVVIVLRKPGILPSNEVERINSRLYRIPNYLNIGTFSIYTLNVAKTKLSPAKVIDYKSNVVLETIPIWNPALRHHSPIAINDVDYTNSINPAKYSNTFENINYDSTLNFWGSNEVGKIWIDYSNLGYKHYYDLSIMPNIQDRINNWGSLAEWSDVDAYEWVESNEIPSSWSGSGSAKKEIYKRTRDYDYVTIQKQELASCKVHLLNSQYGTISGSDETELTSTDYTIQLVLNNLMISQQIINIVVKGSHSKTFDELKDEITSDLPDTISVSILSDGLLFQSTDPAIRTVDVFANESETYDLLYSLTKNKIPLYGKRYNILQHYPTNKFIIDGDFTSVFTPLTNFTVYDSNSGLNNGSYTVSSSLLNNGKTEIIITSTIVSDSGGVIYVQAGTLSNPIPTTIDSFITPLVYPCVQGITLVSGMKVLVKDVVGLPEGLVEGVNYYVLTNPNNNAQFVLSVDISGTNIIEIEDLTTCILMNAEWTNAWTKDSREHAEFLPEVEVLNVTLQNPNIKPCDTVSIFRNGIFQETQNVDALGFITPTFSYNTITIGLNTFIIDTIHVVKIPHVLTDEERIFDPDVEDDGTFLIQYHEDYEYTSRSINDKYTTTTKYYFWVKDKAEVFDKNLLSAKEIAIQLEKIPTSYMFAQNLTRGGLDVDNLGRTVVINDNYNQIIIRGLTNKISDNERYKLRFLQDFSLRDNYNDFRSTYLDLKNKHEEWIMFRENQLSKITKTLWDKLVEALIGYTLESFNTISQVVVPSLERQLYDEQYGTDTRFGLGEGQAFVDKDIGISTVISKLEDSSFDISPIDKDLFLNTYYFDTPNNVYNSLDYIYDNFPTEAVNKIYFEVLYDSFSMKKKYEEIMKTSFISITGVQLLETPETIIDVL